MRVPGSNKDLANLIKQLCVFRVTAPERLPCLCRTLRSKAQQENSAFGACFAELLFLEYAVRFESKEKAQLQLRKMFSICQEKEQELFLAMSGELAAELFIRTGEYELALRYLDKVFESIHRNQDKGLEAAAWICISEIFLQLKQYETALFYCKWAQKMIGGKKKSMGLHQMQGHLNLNMAEIYLRLQKPDKALQVLQKSSVEVKGEKVADFEALADMITAQLSFAAGDISQTKDMLAQAGTKETNMVSASVRARVQIAFAELAQKLQDKELAEKHLQRLAQLPDCCESPTVHLTIANLQVEWCKQWGNSEELLKAYENQYALLCKNGENMRSLWGQIMDDKLRVYICTRENERHTGIELSKRVPVYEELAGKRSRYDP